MNTVKGDEKKPEVIELKEFKQNEEPGLDHLYCRAREELAHVSTGPVARTEGY